LTKNINALIEKWMLCDALWVLRRKEKEYCLGTRGNEMYYSEEYGQIVLIPILLIPTLTEKHP
jgi:hypothetical protein